uniref:Uncharacterized protein n=1 Tax=Romanomermis culicivorax TaxID=13658 RepID=A0A915HMW0_ROMCU
MENGSMCMISNTLLEGRQQRKILFLITEPITFVKSSFNNFRAFLAKDTLAGMSLIDSKIYVQKGRIFVMLHQTTTTNISDIHTNYRGDNCQKYQEKDESDAKVTEISLFKLSSCNRDISPESSSIKT